MTDHEHPSGVPSSGSSASGVATSYAPPIVRGEPVEVRRGVHVIPDNRVSLVPNIGIVVGDNAALVVDTGVGPRNGAFVLDHARRLAGDRPLYLAITQLDPGHGFGAQAFKGAATIIYSSAQHDRLRQNAPAYVAAFQQLGPAVAAELDGLQLVEPDLTYQGQLEIDLGGTHALLRQWGPAHTGDDQTVSIDGQVLFGGDLFGTRMFAILPYFFPFDTHFDGARWIAALDELVALNPDVVVPGHGDVTDVQQIRDVRDYLAYVQSEVRRMRADGVAAEEAAALIEERAVARWKGWETPQWIRYAARAFYLTA